MEFKFNKKKITTDDFWYDLFDGGYIKIETVLKDKEQIKQVLEAKEILKQFHDQLEEEKLINYM